MPADIVTSTTIDLTGIDRILLDSERRVLQSYGQRILRFIRGEWTGWKYAGRPARAPRNVSMRAWKRTLETTENRAVLHLRNEARGWNSGDPYVSHVRRAKGEPLEVDVVLNAVVSDFVPKMKADIIAEVQKNVSAPKRRRKLRSLVSEKTEVLSLER